MVINVFTGLQRISRNLWQLVNVGAGQRKPCSFQKIRAVLDVARKRALAQIQIQRADLMTHPRKRRCHVHRHSGFARATFFISDDDYMRHFLVPFAHKLICAGLFWVTIWRA